MTSQHVMPAPSLDSDISPDRRYMRRAIDLACLGEGYVEPNPMVGCVLVRDSQIIGEGFHEKYGGPHAEVNALRSVTDGDASDAVAYVSLEPCCHHGKTPPCSEALIEAGVKRVVVAMLDPFPHVKGGGLAQLRAAGIEVTAGVLESESRELCAPYLKRIETGLPWVIAKWAMTIDGRIATVSRESQWITNDASRIDVHHLRSRVDAIAVGMGTVIADDPMLNARLPDHREPPRVAHRIVFCRHRLPSHDCKLVTSATKIPLTLVTGPDIQASQLEPFRALGVGIVETDGDPSNQMVRRALQHLGHEGATNLMIEGGGELLASFFESANIDECHVYIGPRLFGGTAAPGPIGGRGIASLVKTPSYQLRSMERLADDIKAVYRRPIRSVSADKQG